MAVVEEEPCRWSARWRRSTCWSTRLELDLGRIQLAHPVMSILGAVTAARAVQHPGKRSNRRAMDSSKKDVTHGVHVWDERRTLWVI